MKVVGFGESAEAKQAYRNRRAELYGKLRELLNPEREAGVFALPPDAEQLRRELAVLPLQYDSEGRMQLPPKEPVAAGPHQGPSLRQLLGRSPDRAVSLWAHSQSGSSLQADNAYPMAFDEFVLDYQPQATWFYRLSQSELLASVRLDAVVQSEHLEEHVYRLPPIAAAVQVSQVLEPLTWLNKTSHPPWQELYTSRLAEVIAYHWGADLDLC